MVPIMEDNGITESLIIICMMILNPARYGKLHAEDNIGTIVYPVCTYTPRVSPSRADGKSKGRSINSRARYTRSVGATPNSSRAEAHTVMPAVAVLARVYYTHVPACAHRTYTCRAPSRLGFCGLCSVRVAPCIMDMFTGFGDRFSPAGGNQTEKHLYTS